MIGAATVGGSTTILRMSIRLLVRSSFLPVAAASLALVFLQPVAVLADETDPPGWADVPLRHIGPIGNRVVAVAGVPGDPLTIYAGAASGGIFASRDGGTTWAPIFDDTPAASIGALAVAPSDPAVVWAGTGETFLRSNVSIGDGVYRSTDAGASWTPVGLERTGRIGRIAVHPDDPDVAWVAALGHAWGPQEDRGLYRTRDGGASWEKVLSVDEETGAIDVVLHPGNPRILFAATWQIRMWTSGRESGGPGSGIWKSTDGGDTWTRLEGAGLPDPPWGKIGLAMSADDPRRVYALIETSSNAEFAPVDEDQGVLWRSDDGGSTWGLVSSDNELVQRPLYYTRAVASPEDSLEITFLSVSQWISHDGGATVASQNSGWDHHDMWIDPLDADRRITGHDGGVSITRNGGETWERPVLPNAQMYRVAVDDRVPYFVFGNRQDGSTAMGPSNSLDGERIPASAWQEVGGCEVAWTLPVPDSERVWAACYDGILHLYDRTTKRATDASPWPIAIESWPAEDLRYRIQWEAPLALSPHDPSTLYYGSQFVHRTRDEGRTWEIVSPDLTTADPDLMRRTGGLTLDDAGPSMAPSTMAIAESPILEGRIWVGTNDGQVQVTSDGGATWTNVTANLPGLPPRGTVTSVAPSPHAAGTITVTVDRHEEGDFATYVYRSTDTGASWTSLRADLPQDVFAFAHRVVEDPEVPGLLYLGTENGLWISLDAGESWDRATGLPPAPVSWIEVQERFGDLVVSTYGRGFWILDDLGPIRWQATEGAEMADDRPRLLPARDAWAFVPRAPAWSAGETAADGTNPPSGALFWVRIPAEGPELGEGDVVLRVTDAEGEPVRELADAPHRRGLHRVGWDLHDEPTPEIRLRTRPEESPRARLELGATREMPDGGRFRSTVDPGTYRVELTVAGETIEARSFEVRADPASSMSDEDRAARRDLVRQLRAQVTEVAEWIDAAEWMRRQIADLRAALESQGSAGGSPTDAAEESSEPTSGILAALGDAEERFAAFEGRFFDLRLTGAGQDSLRWKRLLYSRLVTLASTVEGSDRAPTGPQREVADELSAEMGAAREEWERLRSRTTPELFDALREAAVGPLVLPRVLDPDAGSQDRADAVPDQSPAPSRIARSSSTDDAVASGVSAPGRP